MCSAAAPEATEREAKMNMTVSVKERIPKQRTERRAYVTERARESDSLLVRTDRPIAFPARSLAKQVLLETGVVVPDDRFGYKQILSLLAEQSSGGYIRGRLRRIGA